jgi:hypothetical protein
MTNVDMALALGATAEQAEEIAEHVAYEPADPLQIAHLVRMLHLRDTLGADEN